VQKCTCAQLGGDNGKKESNYVGHWNIFDKYSMNFIRDLWHQPARLSPDSRSQAGNELEMCKTEVAPQPQLVRIAPDSS